MKEKFKKPNLNGEINIKLSDEKGYWEADKAEVLSAIVSVCNEYQENGYTLTLRQLYYQLVSKDYIPNHDKVYKKLSSLKDEVVYGGIVDWAMFEDRGRIPTIAGYDESVSSALTFAADTFRLDRQRDQKVHVEVWTEKDAISSILKKITMETGIRLAVNKGYTSSTAIYGSYRRFLQSIVEGKKVTILYFGDHDPSGLDMIRDINDRITFMLCNGSNYDLVDYMYDWGCLTREDGDTNRLWLMDEYRNDESCWDVVKNDEGVDCNDWNMLLSFVKEHFEIKAIGLTMEQIKLYNPPPNPAKITDPRAKKYVKKFGQKSWEVDALKPAIMEEIVEDAINDVIDMDLYNSILDEESKDRTKINNIVKGLE